ncbi:MAG: hypothetical protein DYG89_28900 [Caldilinea sp. CFX5]|nr:hypothetical protein [Caldilinea sp. CFX5]
MFRKHTTFVLLAILTIMGLLFSACQPIQPPQPATTAPTQAVADPAFAQMLKQVEQTLPATTYVTNDYLPDPAAAWTPLTCPTVDKVRVGLSWVLDDEQALWYNALAKGFYQDVCLDVELVAGGPNIDQLQALRNGEVDVAVTAEGTWLIQTLAQTPDADLMAVGAFLKYSPVAMIGIDRAIPDTQPSTKQITPQDFVGQTIGLPHEGGQLFIRWLAAKYGLPVEQIYTVVEGFDLQPLIKGTVDYHVGWILNEPRLVEQAGNRNWYALLVSDWGWNDYADLMVVRHGLLEQQPDLVKRYLAATAQGLQYLLDHPEESADITLTYATALTLPRELVLRRFELQKPLIIGNDGLPPLHIVPERLNAHAAVLIQQGLLKLTDNPPAVAGAPAQTIAVQPTGDPVQDVANIQTAIDNAKDGDTVLLKAGTFNFGDWKTNPIGGGIITITKGITLTGAGVDANGAPQTIIQGGGYRAKNHWDIGEHGVINFGGDGKGGVLAGVWLKEPHFYGVFISGFVGQNHTDITVRNVKITDISVDIPEWDQSTAIGRPIDMGANVPDWGNGGPQGTITIENCDLSNMGSAIDLSFQDPDSGTAYYLNPDGTALAANSEQGTHAIGLWVNLTANFVVRNNTLHSQHEGLVLEYMSGSGDILVTGNEIVVENNGLPPHLLRGIRLTTTDKEGFPFASTRTVRIENNHIRVVGAGDGEAPAVGMLLSNENGVEGFGAKYVITGNEIAMQNGDAALVLGTVYPPATLKQAAIRDNRISGTARYGILSEEGAEGCMITNNDMSALAPSVAHVGLYGEKSHDNQVTGAGSYEQAGGAHDNVVTGFTAK